MAEKYESVLALMKQRPNGRIEVSDPELQTTLGKLAYRLPTYMSQIRRMSKLEVRGIREGRKVVAYELGALAPAPETQEATPVDVSAGVVEGTNVVSATDAPIETVLVPVTDAPAPVVAEEAEPVAQ